ncbi:unnamed protein product [Effrenium voratum]|uniref:C3H1-type domain-containing protein n=1 Tax=Effrenium voratum TaxID=2562239 RepID=A0AA36MPA3_9DINO|nr:unnamed protein product [Effrenium voratum]CAJ1380205.1 unnamed protein product [Effrenium voratum]
MTWANGSILSSLEVEGQLLAVAVKNSSVNVEPWPADLPKDATVLPELLQSTSAPALRAWSQPWNQESPLTRHQAGTCQPCFFFRARVDGCWKGSQCDRCHICTLEEMHARRNRLQKASKQAAKAAAKVAAKAAAKAAESAGNASASDRP